MRLGQVTCTGTAGRRSRTIKTRKAKDAQKEKQRCTASLEFTDGERKSMFWLRDAACKTLQVGTSLPADRDLEREM